MTRAVITGAGGRISSKIVRSILEQYDIEVVAAIGSIDTPLEGKDIGDVIGVGRMGVQIYGAQDLADVLNEKRPDVVVDFTSADAAVNTVKTSAKFGVNVVVGTTGFSEEQMAIIKESIEEYKIKAVITPNMAVGVNVFFKIVQKLAEILYDYDIEIIETHHRHKADAPSGTALKVYELINDTIGRSGDGNCVHGRPGNVGERPFDEIGLHAVRGGDVVGDHSVLFFGDGERIEIIHRAHTRQSFVYGAIKAVRYVADAPEGKICDMGDVLGIK